MMNEVMDIVKMPEVTAIADVAFMVFTVVISGVRRMTARVRGMSARVPSRTSTMTAALTAPLAVCSPASSDKNHHYGYAKQYDEVHTLKQLRQHILNV
jgi:hypothetical protein